MKANRSLLDGLGTDFAYTVSVLELTWSFWTCSTNPSPPIVRLSPCRATRFLELNCINLNHSAEIFCACLPFGLIARSHSWVFIFKAALLAFWAAGIVLGEGFLKLLLFCNAGCELLKCFGLPAPADLSLIWLNTWEVSLGLSSLWGMKYGLFFEDKKPCQTYLWNVFSEQSVQGYCSPKAMVMYAPQATQVWHCVVFLK